MKKNPGTKILILLMFLLILMQVIAENPENSDDHISLKMRFANWLEGKGLSAGPVVIIVSALPIFELRGGLPLALLFYDMPILKAYLLAIFGNMLPIFPILYLLGPVSAFLMKRSDFFQKFFNWLFARTRRKSDIIRRYEMIGLILFVAIPLPVTGAWTGSMAAFLFGFEPKRSFLMILAGVCIASVIVGIACGGVHILQFLFSAQG